MLRRVLAEVWNVLQAPKLTLLQAIAREEGFYKKGARAQRNNNPGDIEFGQFAKAHGALKAEQPLGRFAVFPDEATGFAAMRALFEAPGYKNLTIRQAIAKWAPPPANDVDAYVANVCKWTGYSESDLIAPLLQA